MNKPMPPERELITFPSYNGYSIGRFEGDTLVIESAGFKGDVTFADATGAPQSDGMKTARAHPQDQPDGARGADHGARSRILYTRLAGGSCSRRATICGSRTTFAAKSIATSPPCRACGRP
jgi:hypothetical protein